MPRPDEGGAQGSEGVREAKRLLDAGHITQEMYAMLVAQDSKYHEHADKKHDAAQYGPGVKFAQELASIGTLSQEHIDALVRADKRYCEKDDRREHFFSSLLMGLDYYIWKPPHLTFVEQRLPPSRMRTLVQKVSEELGDVDLLAISRKLPSVMTQADPALWQMRSRGKSSPHRCVVQVGKTPHPQRRSESFRSSTPASTVDKTRRRQYSKIKKNHSCVPITQAYLSPQISAVREPAPLMEDYCSESGAHGIISVKGLYCSVESDTVGECKGWGTTLRIEVRLVLTPTTADEGEADRGAVPPAFVIEVPPLHSPLVSIYNHPAFLPTVSYRGPILQCRSFGTG
jgi:hypothetical protein